MTADVEATRVGDLFERPPVQFGQRGDAHLWQALRGDFADTPLPGSWYELRTLVADAIERRLGCPLSEYADPPSVYVPEFDPGHGMTAGHVLLAWWVRTGIPIILDRYGAIQSVQRMTET